MTHFQPELLIAVVGLSLLALSASAVEPTLGEMASVRAWVAEKIEGRGKAKPPDVGLEVLASYAPVKKNAHVFGPLKVGGVQYQRGLSVHAYSKIVVRLPEPGKSFAATVGVDSNYTTVGGRGSVEFVMHVGGKESLRSPVLREGMAGLPIKVDLDGAKEFVLEVTDAGDGIGCDQADWADAKITLKSGRALWLADLPLYRAEGFLDGASPPFSFIYDGQPSTDLLKTWKVYRTSKKRDGNRTEYTVAYSDPKTGLVVRCVSVEYHDFPTVEWTVYFKNAGATDTPIIEEIQALDTRFTRYPANELEFALRHNRGSIIGKQDFEPLTTALGPRQDLRLVPPQGRPTAAEWPYYNLDWTGQGVIVAVGWPGQWAARFTRGEGTHLRVQAGQALTHFKLLPGEEVRTPLIVLQFWEGDWQRAQNIWRRWMLAHNVPRPGGKPLAPGLGGFDGYYYVPEYMADEANEKRTIDRYIQEGIKPDYWWMDAGWYVNNGVWWNTGTWEVDRKRYPNGLRGVFDYARSKGMKTIVWFEPERVTPGTWLYDKRPEWLLSIKNDAQKLLNLGNPEARKWVTDHFDEIITKEGIDVYRQDFNMAPIEYWHDNDAPDRQGITENLYVTGYLAFWDELLRRHPNLLIDTCASGGHRDDLETLRRSVPLWRSDYIREPIGMQCQTYGLSFWLPYYGTGVTSDDPYIAKSDMTPFYLMSWDMRRKDLNYDLLRRLVKQWRQIADYYLGDYYPLTSYSLAEDVWMVMQFDRPDLNAGMVQVFRRAESPYVEGCFKLKGLDPNARYAVTDLDSERTREMKGRELMEKGLSVVVKDRPVAVFITYKAIGNKE